MKLLKALTLVTIIFGVKGVFGQSVNPDGSLQYNIPIEVPKGAGPTPQLNISYNSNNPNGMLGVGFRLEGLPVITRGNFGRGINYDGNDTYFGPGGRLILQGSASAEPKVYLPQNYNGSRYLAYGSCGDGPCYWIEETADGAKQYYGTSDNTGANSQGRAIAIENPGQADSVREWALGRVEDSEGRYFEAEWEVDEGMQYPTLITYTKGPGLSQYHTVSFSYDKTSRPDQYLNYGQSARIQTRWRMTAISVQTEEPVLWGLFSWSNLVSRINLIYSGITNITILKKQTKALSDEKIISEIIFNWPNINVNPFSHSISGPEYRSDHGWSEHQHYSTIRYPDINGDGRADICARDAIRVICYLSISNGFNLSHPIQGPEYRSDHGWSEHQHYSTISYPDLNGDGKSDICARDSIRVICYLSNGNGFEFENAIQGPEYRSDHGWSENQHYGTISYPDINGDGRADICARDSIRVICYTFNGSHFTLNNAIIGPEYRSDHGWSEHQHYSTIRYPDINGDGRADICARDAIRVICYLSISNGFNLSHPIQGPEYRSDHGWSEHQHYSTISYPDLNGDGKSDICARDSIRVICYLSNGNGFEFENAIQGPEYRSEFGWQVAEHYSTIRYPDIDGDGVVDNCARDSQKVVCYFSRNTEFNLGQAVGGPSFQSVHGWHAPQHYSTITYTDINGDGKADICARDSVRVICHVNSSNSIKLISVENQTQGSVTEITYTSERGVSPSCPDNLSTGYGQPCGISMNSPRQLVSNIKSYAPVGVGGSDQLVSDTSYSYENSRFFPGTVQQRASLGFGKITQTDNLRNRRVETTYRQDRRYAGLPLEQKSSIGSDLVSHTTHDAPKQFRCDDSGCVEDNTLVLLEPRQVRPGKITTIEYDGIAQITKSQEVLSYDSYGNPTESVESVDANGSRKAIRKSAEYINASGATSIRRMGLPYYQKKCLGSCSATDIIEESYIYFDNQPAGQLGIEGQVTRRESHKVGVILTENLTYNSYGQLVQKVNDAGITEAFEYDSFGHLSKTTVTSGSKSIAREQKIDPRYGVKVWTKDENGIIAENDLDDRGRIVESRMTYNGDLMQKATASYQTDTAPFRATKCKYFGDGLAYSSCETVISDALGRKIYEITPSPQDAAGALVAVKTEYDSLGRAYRVSEPYVSDINGGGSPQRWNTSTFDNRDRVVSVTSVDGKTSSTVYNPALVSGSVSSQEITGPDGSVKRTYVDLSGQPMLIQEAFGTPQYAELKYTYDKFDRLIKVEAPQGITEIEYDALGRQRFIKDPHAGMTEYTYIDDIASPAYGSLLTEKRPAPNAAAGSSDTVTVSFEYNDPWGRLTKSTASDGTTTTYAYDESDMSFSENKLTTLSHTSNYFTVTDRFAYDVYGEVKTSSRRFAHASWNLCEDADALPCFSVVSSETDSLGRVTSFNYPDGTTGDFTYLREFSLPTAMKHEGNTMASWSGYDYRGQTGKVEYANGIETTWNYRADNGLLTNTKTATTGSTPQTLLHQEYSFDNALNITGIQDHIIDDYSVTFTYDKHNRLQTATRNGEVRDYKFDDQTKGNLLERRNLKLVYDTGAIRPQSTQIRDHSTAPWVNSESFEWSSGGNLRFRNHPNNSWEYSYDVDNMMKKAVDAAGNETLFFYDASGQRFLKVYKAVDKEEIRTWYLSDGYELREKFTPDGDEKLSDQATRYFYGPDGKRLASQTGEVTISQASLHYVYAGMFSGTVVGLVKKAYYYAKGGIHDPTVRQSFLVLFAALLVLYLSYYLYCRWEGNTSDRKQSVYVKQIALVLTGLILNFTVTSCMGEGRISISEKKNYDLSFDSLYGGLPVGTYYYTHDHLGSGSLITDDSGNEHLRIVYDEYGNIDQHRSGKFNPETNTISDAAADADKLLLAVKFTGQEYDPETGLYYYNARYYDPALGLFTTPDIYVDGADTTAGYNRYSYVQGNPVKYSDPSGHFISAVITAIVAVAKAVAVGAATGAGISYVASSASTGNWNLDSKKLNVVAQGALIGAASSIGALAGVSASSGIISEGGRVFIENVVGRAVGGALAGGVKASMSGQNFFEGAIKGYAHGALTGLLNGASLGLGDLGMGMSGSMIKDGLANMGSNAVARSMGMSNQSHGMAFGMGFLKGGMRHIVRHISKKYSGAEFEKSKYSTVGNGHTNTDIWDDLAKKYRNGDGSAKYGLLYRFDIKGRMDLSIWDEETAFTRALGLSLNSTSQIHDGINGYLRFINNYREISGFTNVSTMLPSLVAAQQLDRNSFWSYYK